MYTTHISFLLDESSSMHRVRSQTVEAFNLYIAGLKHNPAIHCSLRKFGSTLRDYLYSRIPAAHGELRPENYHPSGNTCLYEAIVTTLEERRNDCGPFESQVIVILTDGENTCGLYDPPTAREAIARARSRGWQILFLGASFDVEALAAKLGVDRAQTLTYDASSQSKDALRRLASSIDKFAGEEPHEEYDLDSPDADIDVKRIAPRKRTLHISVAK